MSAQGLAATEVIRDRRSFACFGLALLLMYIGINLPVSLLEYYRTELGIGSDGTAVLYTVYALAAILAMPLCGTWSDRIGRRPVIALGLVCNALGCLLLAHGSDLTVLIAGRILHGLSVAAIAAPAIAAMAELAPQEAKRRAAVATNLALIVGASIALLGGGTAVTFGSMPQELALSIQAATIVCLLPVVLSARDPVAAGSTRVLPSLARLAAMRGMPGSFWAACAAIFICTAAQSVLFVMAHQTVTGSKAAHPAFFTAALLVLYLAASASAQLLPRHWSPSRGLIAGLTLTSVGMGVLAGVMVNGGFPQVLLALSVAGLGHGLINVAGVAQVNSLAPTADRALVTSLATMARYAGTGGPVLGVGLLAEFQGPGLALGVFACGVSVLSGITIGYLAGSTRSVRRCGMVSRTCGAAR